MAHQASSLTPRQRDIVTILAQFSVETPATVADISKELNISSRTVLRELPTIEQWLNGQQVAFIRKPGVGIALVGDDQERRQVVEKIQTPTTKAQSDKPSRRRLVMAMLLADQEPTKSYSLSKTFAISEGTLSADLDYVQGWLACHEITLHRKTGLGLYVSGRENRLRQAMAALVYEWMQDGVVSSWFLWGNATGDSNQTQGLYTLGLLKQVGDLPALRTILTQSAKDHAVEYTDQGYLTALVHLSIALTRMRKGCWLQTVRNVHHQTLAQRQLAQTIIETIESQFHLTLPETERSAIAAGMMGAVVHQEREPWDEITLRRLVLEMVQMVEQEVNVTLRHDSLLIADLIHHLQKTIHRLQLGVVTAQNTHGTELQQAYPGVYKATEKSCQLLQQLPDAQLLGENEVALIAMHFCAAVERLKAVRRPMQVVVTCPMGMGTSRILVANLEKNFPQIQVKGVVSSRAINTQWLQAQGIDLVVSTVMLELDFPCVCVSPILAPQDIRHLQAFCDQWSPPLDGGVVIETKESPLRDTLTYVQDLTQELTHVLSVLPLAEVEQVDSKAALVKLGAELFAANDMTCQQIYQDLMAREELSETYIDQGKTLLLHCKTLGIDHCHLGYIRLNTPLVNEENQVCGAIIMLAPQAARQVHVEMMGHICSAFLDNQTLNQAVQTGTQQDFAQQIEKVLGRFYTKTLHLL